MFRNQTAFTKLIFKMQSHATTICIFYMRESFIFCKRTNGFVRYCLQQMAWLRLLDHSSCSIVILLLDIPTLPVLPPVSLLAHETASSLHNSFQYGDRI